MNTSIEPNAKRLGRPPKFESKRAKLAGLLDPEDDIDWAERAQVWSDYQPKRHTGRPTYDDLKQPLILSGHGIRIRVEHGTLLVQNGLNYFPQTRGQWRIFPGDPRMPSRIVIIDADGSITFDALVWLSERNIPIVKLNWRGEVVTLGGHRAVDTNLYEAQLRTRASDGGFKFASTLIQAKLENSLSTLHKLPDCSDRQWAIRGVTRALNDLEKTRVNVPMRQLGLVEARAASAYFRGWKSLEIKWTGTNRRPIPEDWYRTGLRASRVSGTNIDATHPVNAMANYAYGVLESQIKIATVAAGLDPTIGYLHAMQEDRAALVYDLMEPLRPIVDRKLLKFIQSNTFSPFDFTLLTSGVCRLHPQLARTVAAIAIAPESVTSVVQKSASMLLSQQSVRPSPRHSRKVELPGGSAIQTQLHGPAFMEDGVTDNES